MIRFMHNGVGKHDNADKINIALIEYLQTQNCHLLPLFQTKAKQKRAVLRETE